MSNYIIVTDSSADLSAQMVEELGVHVLPLSFLLEDTSYYNYPDNRDLAPQDFYAKLRGGAMAQTSAVNVAQYTEYLTPMLEEGLDVLLLSFSSGLSATYQAGVLAAEDLREDFPQRTITVVDTLCASMGQGLLVWHAVQQKNQGHSMEEVAEWVVNHRQNLCHFFTVDDLHFLHRGGRVSATTAMVGSMLSIKPILQVTEEGKLVSVGKSRGRHGALKNLVDRMESLATDPATQTVFISHGDCLADAQAVATMITERFSTQDIRIEMIGPVIGAHAGPGTVALFFLGEHR